MNKYVKIWAMIILLVGIMILPGSAFATAKNNSFIKVYKWMPHGKSEPITDEITIQKKEKLLLIAFLNVNCNGKYKSLPFRVISYELIDSNGHVIKHDRVYTGWVSSKIGLGKLEVGTYQLKVSYKGNIHDGIAPAVKYIKINVIE